MIAIQTTQKVLKDQSRLELRVRFKAAHKIKMISKLSYTLKSKGNRQMLQHSDRTILKFSSGRKLT